MHEVAEEHPVAYDKKYGQEFEMFSQSAGTGILPARLENGVTGEVLAQPAILEQREHAVTWWPERTVLDMSKNRIKSMQGAASSEGNEQPRDLIVLYEKYKRPIHTYV